jgi:cyanophycin synthetase
VRHDAGGATEALSELLVSVAATSGDPDVVRYRRALAAYAAELRHRA